MEEFKMSNIQSHTGLRVFLFWWILVLFWVFCLFGIFFSFQFVWVFVCLFVIFFFFNLEIAYFTPRGTSHELSLQRVKNPKRL